MIRHVTFHARDPYALGTFWAAAVDGRLQDDDAPDDPAALVTSAGPPLLFEQAEGRQVHLDLQPDLPRAQEVARLEGLGASVVADHTRPDGTGWVVMTDPEGNPFCVERSAPSAARSRGPPATATCRPCTPPTSAPCSRRCSSGTARASCSRSRA